MYNKTVLDNGLTIISEKMDSYRSVSIGIWVAAGSRQETPEEAGLAHFIEHTTFKGTTTRNPQEIAREVESVGGILNAMTDKETCCFYCKILGTHLDRAVNLLSDIVLNSTYPADEMEKEKKVILEEISMYEDDPDEVSIDKLTEGLWPGSSLGRPTIGFRETVNSFNKEFVDAYRKRNYVFHNLIVSAAGDVDHQQLVDLVKTHFDHLPGSDHPIEIPPTPPSAYPEMYYEKPVEQIHFSMATDSYARDHRDRYALTVLSTILGGGMSSRLFQEIREKRGLVYGIGTFGQSYRDTGIFGIYGGTSPEYFKQVKDLIFVELAKVGNEAVPEQEFMEAREQIKGHLVLGLESTNSRMNRLAEQEIYYQTYLSIDDILTKIDSVTIEDVQRISKTLLQPERMAWSVVGPVAKLDK